MGRFLECMGCVAAYAACLGIAVIGVGCGGEGVDDPRGSRIEGTEPGDCEDGADNDADGLFDCADPSCEASPLCGGGAGGASGTGGAGGVGGSVLCADVDCNDSNECTADACNPADGECDYTLIADGLPCDFGGLPGVCTAGVCEDAMLCAGVDCDDGNECTTDTCDPTNGSCDHTNVIDSTACDFGSLPGICTAGVCEDAMLCSGVDCDDGNECTQDACDPMDGQCGHADAMDGTTCDFGSLPGICTAGVCEDAMLCSGVDCDDGNECTQDACDPMDGQCGHANAMNGTTCDFGGLPGVCTAAVCEDAMLCAGVDCDDQNDCTTDTCDPMDGTCGHTNGVCDGCFPVICSDGNSYGCGDCLDNDGDGLADDKDPECLGPCDDTEGPILLTGTPGETGNQCGADCYFDRGNGSGSGECKWDRRCDPLEPKDACTYDEGLIGAANYCPDVQPDGCADGCGVLTPNGCDCFGCCTFPELNGEYVFLGSYIGNDGSCTLDDLQDPDLCRPCTPAGNCLNTCERCELCLGKTEIPADCFPGTGGSGGMGGSGGSGGTGGSSDRCSSGVQACGLPGDPPCPAGGFCLTGCCILVQ